jgi:hypothetical protein
MACLLALLLLGLAEVMVRTPAAGRWLAEHSDHRLRFREAGETLETSAPSMLILGNSMSAAIDTELVSRLLYDGTADEAVTVNVGGGTPRTLERLLEPVSAASPRDGGIILYMITPMCLNRNNPSFLETVGSLFTMDDLFDDLVPQRRYDEAKFLLLNRSLRLVNQRQEIRDALRRSVGWPGETPEPARPRSGTATPMAGTTARPPVFRPEAMPLAFGLGRDRVSAEETRITLSTWASTWCRDYEIDPYQLGALRRIARRAGRRGVETVILLPPLSAELRRTLGPRIIHTWRDTVLDFGRQEPSVRVIDLLARGTGDEYIHTDGVHFGRRSAQKLTATVTEQLAADLNR